MWLEVTPSHFILPEYDQAKDLLSSLLTMSTSSKEKSVEMEMICFYISTCLPSPSF